MANLIRGIIIRNFQGTVSLGLWQMPTHNLHMWQGRPPQCGFGQRTGGQLRLAVNSDPLPLYLNKHKRYKIQQPAHDTTQDCYMPISCAASHHDCEQIADALLGHHDSCRLLSNALCTSGRQQGPLLHAVQTSVAAFIVGFSLSTFARMQVYY